MSDLSKYPALDRKKSGIYAVRLRVPKDLLDLVGVDAEPWNAISLHPGSPLNAWRDPLTTTTKSPRGPTETKLKREFKRSLNVRTLEDAKPAYFALRDELERVFNTIRRAYAQELRPATPDDFASLASDYFVQIEAKAEREATRLMPYPDERLEACDNIAEDIHELETGHPSFVANHQKTARSILLENGLQTDANGQAELTGLLIRKALHSFENSLQRYQGKFDTGVNPQSAYQDAVSERPQNDHPLGVTFDRYLEDKQRLKIKSLEYLEAFGRLMLDFFGADASTSELTRQGARDFMHMLEHMPPNVSKTKPFSDMSLSEASKENERLGGVTIAPATLKKSFSIFRAFLNWCVAEQILERNVALELKPVAANPPQLKKREPFEVQELQMIFGADYIRKARPNHRTAYTLSSSIPIYARYWVPLIAVFSGMRLQEICQLEVTDIDHSDDVHFIQTNWDITEEHDDQSGRVKHLKNNSSERFIPIHPELERLGLIKFWRLRQDAEDTWLFPELTARRDGKVSRGVGDWFGRYLDEIGISARSKVFHSFRYNFRGAMSVADVNPDVIRQVGGWASKDTADHYSFGRRLSQAKNEISRVTYKGLDLSHLYN